MNWTPLAGIAFLVGLTSCPSLPTPAEVRATGFRSPEQCFRTFQCAVRADDPAWEYQCFSGHFRSQNHVSQLVWREVREQLWGQVGMRWAVANAKPSAPARVQGKRAWMEVSALGKRVRLEFVIEEFGKTWNGETLLSDEELDFRRSSGVQDGRWFYGQVQLPEAVDPATVTEMNLGQEWKLDLIDPDPGS